MRCVKVIRPIYNSLVHTIIFQDLLTNIFSIVDTCSLLPMNIFVVVS